MRTPHIFSGSYLDRHALSREDRPWLQELESRPDAVLVPVWQLRNLIREQDGTPVAHLLHWPQAAALISDPRDLILLGEFRSRLCFAFEVAGDTPPTIDGTEFRDLRGVGSVLPGDEAGLLAYARAMIHWRSRHRYCGTCGAPTISARSGHLLKCSQCDAQQFPRIDPAIIVLVSRGTGAAERALLGRKADWAAGRYSTIAGFVEPGESLEDAVAREVFEETGIQSAAHVYHSSQPWPFPASLMLGFTARALTGAITCRDGELEDARWFSRQELTAGQVLLPPRQSISHRLIEDWRTSPPATDEQELQAPPR